MNERVTKTGFHVLMVGCALWEYSTARSTFRKQVAGAFAGFHVASAILDWLAHSDCEESTS